MPRAPAAPMNIPAYCRAPTEAARSLEWSTSRPKRSSSAVEAQGAAPGYTWMPTPGESAWNPPWAEPTGAPSARRPAWPTKMSRGRWSELSGSRPKRSSSTWDLLTGASQKVFLLSSGRSRGGSRPAAGTAKDRAAACSSGDPEPSTPRPLKTASRTLGEGCPEAPAKTLLPWPAINASSCPRRLCASGNVRMPSAGLCSADPASPAAPPNNLVNSSWALSPAPPPTAPPPKTISPMCVACAGAPDTMWMPSGCGCLAMGVARTSRGKAGCSGGEEDVGPGSRRRWPKTGSSNGIAGPGPRTCLRPRLGSSF
mmetsp:Transcript_125533/g.401996  ORF Transcript_125533/g.401996 Transcript_125533/m.401996 type:complete len:312 (+) Transcript_125533:203-1138(+)